MFARMDTETTFSRWLRAEMGARGYPVGAARSGGISRLSEDAGVPQGSLSRIINGHAEPSLDNLRRIGRLFKLSLPEMMIHAGFMEIDELQQASLSLGPFTEDGLVTLSSAVEFNRLDPAFPDDVKEGWASYPAWQRMIWHLPDLTEQDKRHMMTALYQRWGIIAEGKREGREQAEAEVLQLRSSRRKHAG